ncbi:hypothetical protein B0H13DRAFT_2308776 [Mycena leptocephala]|nr:hypothetical protein B0H13DRAFT_2308776 [Mycena leptocephala]
MTTTQKTSRFPAYLPRDRPPPVRGTIVEGEVTPRYALAWVRHPFEVQGEHPKRDLSTIQFTVFEPRWAESGYSSCYPGFIFNPDAFLGPGPELHIYYLFAYNYDQNTIDLAANDDGFIAAWRHTLDIKSGDEHTLRWYKLPVRWTTHRNPRTALKPKELQD